MSPDLVVGLFPAWYAAPQPDRPPQLRFAWTSDSPATKTESGRREIDVRVWEFGVDRGRVVGVTWPAADTVFSRLRDLAPVW